MARRSRAIGIGGEGGPRGTRRQDDMTRTLREPFKLALSMTLFYWLALWMNWDMPKYGALAIALVSLGTAGASIQKGVARIAGTTVGLAVGMLGLALFAQDRWGMLLFLSSYLVVIGYFMPASRNGYAWYVAGFIAPLVWATTYGVVDNAFHYATFRYLETSAGILIYTMVSVVLWPRRAGEALDRQGEDLWPGLRRLFGVYRQELEEGRAAERAVAPQSRLAGLMSQMDTTLQAAFADTPAVRSRRRDWETFRLNLRATSDALELWRESIDDSRRLEPARLIVGLDAALATIDRRLARMEALWRARVTGDEGAEAGRDDETLLRPLDLDVDPAAAEELAHFDRAVALGFAQQLRTLDLASRELLGTMRCLTEAVPGRRADDRWLSPEAYRPPRWDPVRLVNAMFPVLCFAAAYVFWIYFDPPTGPSVPNMAATFGLIMLLTPMNAVTILVLLIGAIAVAVAPVYLFVMPRLETGFGLLALIFGYTFTVGLLGQRSPPVKAAVLPMFVMMTGISNEQVYSFLGLVDRAMMMGLGILFVAIVQILLTPSRPERVVVRSVRRFFRGCALITAAFARPRPRQHARARTLRKRYYESMVLPVPRRLQAVEQKLEYGLFPANGPEKVRCLLDALQSLARRLQSLEIAYGRVVRRSAVWSAPLATMGAQIRESLERVFHAWSRLDLAAVVDERSALRDLARGLERTLEDQLQSEQIDDEALVELYAMLGCARGLIRAAGVTAGAMRSIDWDQWTEARF
jgi:uncharacterized membrane protein YccC